MRGEHRRGAAASGKVAGAGGGAAGDTPSARAGALGGTVLEGPVDFPWVRKAIIADPQGAVFTASQFTPQG